MFISPEQSIGNLLKMKTNHPLHYNGLKEKTLDDNVSGSFANALMKAVGKVNNLLVDANDLTEKMIHEPESVDIHTVMIAGQKAEIALNFTKAVRDEAVRSYRDLMNLR
ncbi:MAG: flagellar hook-basal body complex protein FliE [Spirochaetes bacterium]|nr:flagellar hook-basal body complex protein FliE [Spirochaetota bacterium]